MIKKLLISLSVALVAFGTFSQSAFAHVFLESGTMEIFSHIDPDDDPIAGEQAQLFFIFADSANAFNSSKCDCSVSISYKDGDVLLKKKLFEIADPSTTEFSFTFPERAIYDIKITGKPLSGATFASFETHRILRVEKTTASPAKDESADFGHYILIGIAALVIIAIFVSESLRAKKAKTKGSAGTGFLLAIAAISMLGLSYHEIHAMEFVGGMDCHDEHECCKIQAVHVSSSMIPQSARLDFGILEEKNSPTILFPILSDSINNNSPPFE